jgi:hypothetical protein
MAALNRPPLWRCGSIHPRDIFPSMYKRNLRKEKDIENISNPARTQPHTCLGLEMKEQLQFVIQVLNARLSDQTPTSEQHGRGADCVKAHDRIAAQNTRP